jgi:hypothetical protein
MKFSFAPTLIFGCLAASGAGAQMSTTARATLAAPVGKADLVVVDDRPWRCEGQVCGGPAGDSRFDDQRSCRDLAQKIGAVTAFEGAKGTLAAEDLVRCNKYARSSR